MSRRQWKMYGRFDHSPLVWDRIGSSVSSLEAAREKLHHFFHIARDVDAEIIEGRITGPGVSLSVWPRWPGPGEDFAMIERNELEPAEP